MMEAGLALRNMRSTDVVQKVAGYLIGYSHAAMLLHGVSERAIIAEIIRKAISQNNCKAFKSLVGVLYRVLSPVAAGTWYHSLLCLVLEVF